MHTLHTLHSWVLIVFSTTFIISLIRIIFPTCIPLTFWTLRFYCFYYYLFSFSLSFYCLRLFSVFGLFCFFVYVFTILFLKSYACSINVPECFIMLSIFVSKYSCSISDNSVSVSYFSENKSKNYNSLHFICGESNPRCR